MFCRGCILTDAAPDFFVAIHPHLVSSNLVSKMAVFETKGSLIHRLISISLLFETKDMLTRWRERAKGQA